MLWIGMCFLIGCHQSIEENTGKRERFPPIDLRCQQDSDCAKSLWYLTDDDRCCGSCSYQVATQSWVAEVEKICMKKRHEGCPVKKCAESPTVKCVAGRCTAIKEEEKP